MLKHCEIFNKMESTMQPPSGGCVLKLNRLLITSYCGMAATFGWLCVETSERRNSIDVDHAATFGWLCVETFANWALFGESQSSHLRVAVC